MKIEFGAGYTQVNKLAFSKDQTALVNADDQQFEGLLQGLVKDVKAAPGLTLMDSASVPSNFSDAHYRINIKAPELQQPSSAPIMPASEPTEGVKTPTVVSAHRMPAQSKIEAQDKNARLKQMISETGARFGIDPTLSLAVVATESSFDPKAVSSDGFASKGLFQLLDSTGKHMLQHLGMESSYDPFNPKQNIELGVGYLRKLHELFNSSAALENNTRTFKAANSSSLEKLAVAAFNAGEGRVASAQERAQRLGKDPAHYDQVAPYLPESTKEYVKRVLQFRTTFDEQNQSEDQPLE